MAPSLAILLRVHFVHQRTYAIPSGQNGEWTRKCIAANALVVRGAVAVNRYLTLEYPGCGAPENCGRLRQSCCSEFLDQVIAGALLHLLYDATIWEGLEADGMCAGCCELAKTRHHQAASAFFNQLPRTAALGRTARDGASRDGRRRGRRDRLGADFSRTANYGADLRFAVDIDLLWTAGQLQSCSWPMCARLSGYSSSSLSASVVLPNSVSHSQLFSPHDRGAAFPLPSTLQVLCFICFIHPAQDHKVSLSSIPLYHPGEAQCMKVYPSLQVIVSPPYPVNAEYPSTSRFPPFAGARYLTRVMSSIFDPFHSLHSCGRCRHVVGRTWARLQRAAHVLMFLPGAVAMSHGRGVFFVFLSDFHVCFPK